VEKATLTETTPWTADELDAIERGDSRLLAAMNGS
jgi:hypothetical protein